MADYYSFIVRLIPDRDQELIDKIQNQPNKNDYIKCLIEADFVNPKLNDERRDLIIREYYWKIQLKRDVDRIITADKPLREIFSDFFLYMANGDRQHSAMPIDEDLINLFFCLSGVISFNDNDRQYARLSENLRNIAELLEESAGNVTGCATNPNWLKNKIRNNDWFDSREIRSLFKEYWSVLSSSSYTYIVLSELADMSNIQDTRANYKAFLECVEKL